MVPIFGPLCKLPQRDLAQSPGRKRIVECLILETTEPAWLLHIWRSRPTSVLQNLKIEILRDNHYFLKILLRAALNAPFSSALFCRQFPRHCRLSLNIGKHYKCRPFGRKDRHFRQ